MANNTSPHIVVVPTPGMGHLIPLGEFAKRVVLNHGLTATFVIPTDSPLSGAQKGFLEALPEGIDYVALPPSDFDDEPSDAKIETIISLTIVRSLEKLRAAIKSLNAGTRYINIYAYVFFAYPIFWFDPA